MTTVQILWGSLAILAVFVLNQVFGRIIGQFLGKENRDCDRYVGRREHTMCSAHNDREMAAVTGRIDEMDRQNRHDHKELFSKIDEVKTLIMSQNGKH